jgi:hypothetical protein
MLTSYEETKMNSFVEFNLYVSAILDVKQCHPIHPHKGRVNY